MRPIPAIAIASVLASTAAYPQASTDAPRRMPGLWEMTTIIGDKDGVVHNFQACIDADHDNLLLQPGEPVPQCTRSSWRRDGHYRHFDADCSVEGSTAKMQGVFSGDFAYNFQGEVRTTYSPPRKGLSALTMHMEGRRLASCRAGQTPGRFMTPVR